MASKQLSKRRIPKACNYCRKRKIKCNGNTPCTNCTTHKIECEYSPAAKRKRKTQTSKLSLYELDKRINKLDQKFDLLSGQVAKILALLNNGKGQGENLMMLENDVHAEEGDEDEVDDEDEDEDDFFTGSIIGSEESEFDQSPMGLAEIPYQQVSLSPMKSAVTDQQTIDSSLAAALSPSGNMMNSSWERSADLVNSDAAFQVALDSSNSVEQRFNYIYSGLVPLTYNTKPDGSSVQF